MDTAQKQAAIFGSGTLNAGESLVTVYPGKKVYKFHAIQEAVLSQCKETFDGTQASTLTTGTVTYRGVSQTVGHNLPSGNLAKVGADYFAFTEEGIDALVVTTGIVNVYFVGERK